MGGSKADSYATRGAGLVQQLVLMEEEQRPLPAGPSPAMLVARVTERLIQASCAIEWEQSEEENRLQVAVYLIGAAGFALTAIAHIHGDLGELTRFKDRLVEQLDDEVADLLEQSQEAFANASQRRLLHDCLASLVGACQAVVELEGVQALPDDEREDDAPADDEDLLERVGDSLWQTAVLAAGAGQWLVEQHESRAV